MAQVALPQKEEPEPFLVSELPGELVANLPVEVIAKRWPWQLDFLKLFSRYWTARQLQAWPRALRSLHEARCFAIAGEQWELESWINILIVEAIAKREAKCR